MVCSRFAGVIGEGCSQNPDESPNTSDSYDLALLDNIFLGITLVQEAQKCNAGEPYTGNVSPQHVIPIGKVILPEEIPDALDAAEVIFGLSGKLAWETLVRWRSGDGVVHTAESPSVVDQQIYVASLLADFGHGSIQRCFVGHIRDDRYNVPMGLKQSISWLLVFLRPCHETYRILFGCSFENLLASAEDINSGTIVLEGPSNHQTDTSSTTSHDSNKAVDGEEVGRV